MALIKRLGTKVLTLISGNSSEQQSPKSVTLQWTLRRHLAAPAFRRKLSAKNREYLLRSDEALPAELFNCDAQGHPLSTPKGKPGLIQPHAELRLRPYDPVWAVETTQLFNDGQRASDLAMPMVRFFHTRKSVGIRFIGPQAIRLAVLHTQLLCKMVDEIFDSNKFRRTTELVEVKFNPDVLSEYVIDTLVLPTNILNRQLFTELQWVERLIQLDIRRQANILGLELPKDFSLRVVHTEGVKYSVRVNGSILPVYCSLTVHSNLKLIGHWAAGSLVSKGHGTIISDRDLSSPKKPALLTGTHGIDEVEMMSMYGLPIFTFPPSSNTDLGDDYL